MDFQKSPKCQIVGIPQIFSSKYMHFLTLFLDTDLIPAKMVESDPFHPKMVGKCIWCLYFCEIRHGFKLFYLTRCWIF